MAGLSLNKNITDQLLLELIGTDMDNSFALARRLKVCSVRIVDLILEKTNRAFSEENKKLISGWFNGLNI